MSIVNGNAGTFGLESASLIGLKLIFTPSGPAVVDPTYLLLTKPVVAVVATDGSGAFTVNLAPTDDMHPLRWYTLKAEWLDPAGGFTQVDFIDWKLFVPTAGGDFAELIEKPTNPQLAFTSLTPPPNPTSGTWWLESNPDDIADPANTGNLYEWSN